MAVPPLSVRVSLFQARADAKSSCTTVVGHVDDGTTGTHDGAAKLLRSCVDNYRGDVLLPLPSLTSSTKADDACESRARTAAQLIAGLEQRLTRYCVLHVPKSRMKTFVQENCLSESALIPHSAQGCSDILSPADADDGEDGTQRDSISSTRYCADCSAPLVKEAAGTSGVLSDEKVPWIRICQLQRMLGERGGSTARIPTAEEWMLRQQGPTDLYVSDDEANALPIEPVEADSFLTGGECFAAFFQLQMISPGEREKKLISSQEVVDEPPPAMRPMQPAAQSFFTVHAFHNTVRIGLPPPLSASSDERKEHLRNSALPSLRSVVWSRLQAQRGVKVRRLLDPQTGAAVLPCESTSALMAASLTTFVAECDEPAEHQQREGPTQELPGLPSSSTSTPAVQTQRLSRGARSCLTQPNADLFENLVGLRAQRREDQYYYDGFQSRDWADQRTAISLSELPSESELRMTSVASQASDFTAIYPHPSSSRHPSQASRTTASAFTVSTENSRSRPFPVVPDEGEETSNGGVVLERRGESDHDGKNCYSGDVTAQNVAVSRDTHNADATARSPGSTARDTVSPFVNDQSHLFGLQDSLRDMNEVFLYEDEETVIEPQDGGQPKTDLNGQDESFSPRQRRGSLVWSTPAARGCAGGFNFAERGMSTTPLTYRTSTQLSTSPAHSPHAAYADEHKREMMSDPPVQRFIFPLSPSQSPSTSTNGNAEEDGEERRAESMLEQANTGAFLDDLGASAPNEGVDEDSVEDEEDSEANDEASTESGAAVSSDRPSPSRSHPRPNNGHKQQEVDTETIKATATPLRQQFSPSSSTHHFACTPPSHSKSSASPSSPLPLSVTLSQVDSHLFASAGSDEATTPLPYCATSSSRCRTAEQELRGHLRSLNPLSTQSSQTKSQGMGKMGSGRRQQEHDQHAPPPGGNAWGPRFSSAAGPQTTKRPRENQDGGVVDALHSATPRRDDASWRSTPHGSHARPVGTDAARVGSTSSSPPSTVAARRQARHRSPIYFSPDELLGMTANPLTASGGAKSSRFASCSSSLSSRGGSASGERASEAYNQGAQFDRRYPPFIASYPLHESDFMNAGDGVAKWGHESGTPNPRSSPRKQHPQNPQQHNTPSQPLTSSGPDLHGCRSPLHPPPFVSCFPESFSARRRRQYPSQPQPQMTDTNYTPGTVRVSSQRLRRSESHSASGIETWVRFSDVDGDETSGKIGCAGVSSGDDDELMLVTQQEIPDYTAELSSSDSEEAMNRADDEEDESDGSTESS
ncbi:hypothetical protein ABB37_02902 [Leptomonas pyrrhocoris]|uniref:Uncharacterized protein n=1 Tax=Leptomonas pyrrhocoris TaxID=157538 RepID=A0A0M9G6E9_LEPPY|nr:hypothetical protein ABB37_02902 [Leptomonas pyrrhocoris]KPA83219.1 hypothetical protein ABB37_02902 [Leptomonas pyrrhocoris]|eukprot:XP_015661658.1 hypothetical protein ABB37_02902 [Leptomonas pyrrhocoris]